ncbi:hypothetical protein [Streptomyces sp. NPDC057199]|uniref:hypothetical protein n=1 Tax=Streptomyces sp. NPDC057199 TaxID=3346047 RepID=UPI003636DF45
MSVDLATCVREHTKQYAAAHGGQHPLTECLPWAEALVSWVEALPCDDNHSVRRRRYWYDPRLGLDGLALAIAESIRLAMAVWDRPIGDLFLDNVQRVLFDWIRWDIVPGTPRWPAPDGTPHEAHWKVLFATDIDLAREAAYRVSSAYEQLEDAWNAIPMSEAWRHRLDTYGITYARLADVAPLLGLTMPIEVREPGDYVNVPDLLVERATA